MVLTFWGEKNSQNSQIKKKQKLKCNCLAAAVETLRSFQNFTVPVLAVPFLCKSLSIFVKDELRSILSGVVLAIDGNGEHRMEGKSMGLEAMGHEPHCEPAGLEARNRAAAGLTPRPPCPVLPHRIFQTAL